MGQSTDGQLSYGVVFEDGQEFPWADDSGGIDDWWRKQQGFKDSIHDDDGNWIGGVKPNEEAYDLYFAERSAFDAAHPLPVTEVNYCSGEYPMIILAVPSSYRRASRGYPEKIDVLPAVSEAEKTALRELSSYWG